MLCNISTVASAYSCLSSLKKNHTSNLCLIWLSVCCYINTLVLIHLQPGNHFYFAFLGRGEWDGAFPEFFSSEVKWSEVMRLWTMSQVPVFTLCGDESDLFVQPLMWRTIERFFDFFFFLGQQTMDLPDCRPFINHPHLVISLAAQWLSGYGRWPRSNGCWAK